MPYSPNIQKMYAELVDQALSYITTLLPAKKPPFSPKKHSLSLPNKDKQEIPPTIVEAPLKKNSSQEKKEPLSQPKQKSSSPSPFSLSPPSPPSPLSFVEMKQTFQTLFPQLPIREEIPPDQRAKERQISWQSKKHAPLVALLIHNPSFLPFFTNVSLAITRLFGKAVIFDPTRVEKENQWEKLLHTSSLQLIIASDAELFHAKSLLHYYKEIPTDRRRFLGDIPLLLLPNPSLYLKDPLLKKSLWNLIKQHLL